MPRWIMSVYLTLLKPNGIIGNVNDYIVLGDHRGFFWIEHKDDVKTKNYVTLADYILIYQFEDDDICLWW